MNLSSRKRLTFPSALAENKRLKRRAQQTGRKNEPGSECRQFKMVGVWWIGKQICSAVTVFSLGVRVER